MKSTPSFFIFKDGVVTHMHSGSNPEKFDDAIAEQIGVLPRGTFAAKWNPPVPSEATLTSKETA